MPCDWNLGIIYPIYKKGDRLDCNNYRGITVLNTAYKKFSLILQEDDLTHVEEIVGNYQRGFRNGKSTTDQIFTMRQILEKMAEYRHDTYHLFIDFKAAYDSIARVKLYDAMSSFGIPAKLIRLVRMTMTNVTCQVRVDGKLSFWTYPIPIPCSEPIPEPIPIPELILILSRFWNRFRKPYYPDSNQKSSELAVIDSDEIWFFPITKL